MNRGATGELALVRSRTARICLGIIVVSAALFWKALDAASELGPTVRADRSLLGLVVDHRSAWLTDVARAWTLLGSAWIVVPVVSIAVVGLSMRHHAPAAVIVAASSLGSALAVTLVKASVARPRPPVGGRLVSAVGAAFPSGHAAQSVACYAALAWAVTVHVDSRAIRRSAWSGATLIALGVGWSRLYLGVHWPSDVLGGWAIAAGWLAALVLADRVGHRRNGQERRLG